MVYHRGKILQDLGGRGKKEETILHYGKKQGRDLVDPVQGGKFQGVDECRRKKVSESWRLEWKEEKDPSGWSADQTRLADFYCVK